MVTKTSNLLLSSLVVVEHWLGDSCSCCCCLQRTQLSLVFGGQCENLAKTEKPISVLVNRAPVANTAYFMLLALFDALLGHALLFFH